MKKAIFIIVLIYWGHSPLFSQEISVGVEGGLRSNFVYQSNRMGNHQMYFTPAYLYGLKATVTAGERLIIQSGLIRYDMQVKLDMSEPVNGETIHPVVDRFSVTQIPLHFIFPSKSDGSINLSPLVGGSVFSANVLNKGEARYTTTNNYGKEVVYYSSSYYRDTWCIDAGAILTSNISEVVTFQTSLLMSKGFNRAYQINLTKNEGGNIYSFIESFTNLDGFVLGVSLHYKVKKAKSESDSNER